MPNIYMELGNVEQWKTDLIILFFVCLFLSEYYDSVFYSFKKAAQMCQKLKFQSDWYYNCDSILLTFVIKIHINRDMGRSSITNKSR